MPIYKFKLEFIADGTPFEVDWGGEVKRILGLVRDAVTSPLQQGQPIHNADGMPVGTWGSIIYAGGIASHWAWGKNFKGKAPDEVPVELETYEEAKEAVLALMELDRDELLSTAILNSPYYNFIQQDFSRDMAYMRSADGAVRVSAGQKEYWIIEVPQE